jgi:hypothetical protein
MAGPHHEPSTTRRRRAERDDLWPITVSTTLATSPLTILVTADHRQARMEYHGRPERELKSYATMGFSPRALAAVPCWAS